MENLGTKLDMKWRTLLARVDDNERKGKIQAARRSIYEGKYAVNSTVVENLLKEQSLVPTLVSEQCRC
jgi:hypothetical protein